MAAIAQKPSSGWVDDAELSRIGWQRFPELVADELWLLMRRQTSLEHSQGLSETCRGWSDDAMQPELVGGHADSMAGGVVAHIAQQLRYPDPDLISNIHVTKVENLRDTYPAREKTTGTHELRTHPFNRIDQVAVCLDSD
jgi:hypothetical protein